MSNSRSPSKEPTVEPAPKLASLAKRRERVALVLARLAEASPDPRCELVYRTPFQLLVSVVLSAQTTDKMVNRCMAPLYEAGFGVADVLRLGEAGLLDKIRTIGLAPTKARNVTKLAQMLVERHGGEVPRRREELEALPGVGRKTANVVLGEIWREPTLAVDTHVFRVTRRLGLHDEPTPEKCEKLLLSLVDPALLPQGHHWLILHGRYTCKAQSPACGKCIVADLCPMRAYFARRLALKKAAGVSSRAARV
jgi:endonuclease-3